MDILLTAQNVSHTRAFIYVFRVHAGGAFFTERNGTERNAGLFQGTDKCDQGTIILKLEYL